MGKPRLNILIEDIHDPNRGLPPLPPNPGMWMRFKYNFQNSILASEQNDRTKYYLKTRAAVAAERVRQLESYWYIVHPLSVFNKYREMFITYVWFVTITYDVFAPAFQKRFDQDHGLTLRNTVFSCNILDTLHMVLMFFTGYIDDDNLTVLEPKRIARKFIFGYFVCDFVSFICIIRKLFFAIMKENTKRVFRIVRWIHVLRLKTALIYFRWTTRAFRLNYNSHLCLRLCIFTCLLVHFNACFIFLISDMMNDENENEERNSWLKLLENEYMMHNRTLEAMEYYLHCLHVTLLRFHGMELHTLRGRTIEDVVIGVLLYICAMIHIHFYIVGFMYYHLDKVYKPGLKVSNQAVDLEAFMERRTLSPKTRRYLRVYYKEFNMEFYYKENKIRSLLTPNLRLEVRHNGIRHLFQEFGHQLPRDTEISIAQHTRVCLYLTGETILHQESPVQYLFIIVTGSVACYNDIGKEVEHLHDGNFFGEIELILLPQYDKRILNIVSLELTKIYRISKNDFYNLISENEMFYDYVFHLAQTRIRKYRIDIKKYRNSALLMWRQSVENTDSDNDSEVN